MAEIKNNKQVSAVLYVLPFSSKGNEIRENRFVIDENLILTKMNINDENALRFRNLMRSDIKWCVDNLSIYSLRQTARKEDKDIFLSLKSFAVLKEFNQETRKNEVVGVKETNLSDIVKLLDLRVYHFDNENQFLVMQCTLDKMDNENGIEIETLIKGHAHIMNNYFKKPTEREIDVNEKYDLSTDERHPDSYLRIDYTAINKLDKNINASFSYYLDSDFGNSISKKEGISFDFNNYHIRALSQMMVLENNYDKKLLAEQLATGSRKPMLIHEDHIFVSRKLISLSTCFGSSLVYWREDDESQIAWETRNRNTVQSLYNEFLYDFLIALNYHIRVEKQINRIGHLNFDAKDSAELKLISDEINEYRKNTAKYYFLNVSRLDYVNEWYRRLVDGLNTDALDEELETKLKYSLNYLDNRMANAIHKENWLFNSLVAAASICGNIAIFILTLFQVIPSFSGEVTSTDIAFYIVAGVVVLVSIIFWIIFLIKKHKTNKKYGND